MEGQVSKLNNKGALSAEGCEYRTVASPPKGGVALGLENSLGLEVGNLHVIKPKELAALNNIAERVSCNDINVLALLDPLGHTFGIWLNGKETFFLLSDDVEEARA